MLSRALVPLCFSSVYQIIGFLNIRYFDLFDLPAKDGQEPDRVGPTEGIQGSRRGFGRC